MDSVIIVGAKYLFAAVAIGAMLPVLKMTREERSVYLLQVIFSGFIAFVLTKIAGRVYDDPRPFTQGVHALIAHDAENGFPSDHTVLSFTAALLTLRHSKPLAATLLGLAAIVGACRVLAGVHHIIDIVAGVAIAIVAVVIAIPLAKLPFASRDNSQESQG